MTDEHALASADIIAALRREADRWIVAATLPDTMLPIATIEGAASALDRAIEFAALQENARRISAAARAIALVVHEHSQPLDRVADPDLLIVTAALAVAASAA